MRKFAYALAVALLFAGGAASAQQNVPKNQIEFMPPGAIPSGQGSISFNTGGTPSNPVWVELPTLGQVYSAGTISFLAMDSAPALRLAQVYFWMRAIPIGSTFQARLVSYYYDASNNRVYDRTWPIVTSMPNFLCGSCSAWVHDKINEKTVISPTNPQYRAHHVLIEVSGSGTMFGARLETQ